MILRVSGFLLYVRDGICSTSPFFELLCIFLCNTVIDGFTVSDSILDEASSLLSKLSGKNCPGFGGDVEVLERSP